MISSRTKSCLEQVLRCAGRMLGAALVLASFSAPALSAVEEVVIDRQSWTFSGVFGRYDRAQLQRGYKVYKEVCASCHAMKFLRFRNLAEEGGPGFNETEVEAIAAEFEVKDGPNDEGEMFERPAKPADVFAAPYENDAAARSANNSALPPDLSVIAKARSIPNYAIVAPVGWAIDIATGYQEGGADYLYALLTSYKDDVPAGIEIAEGMSYNAAFPGYQIAMPNPMSDGQVDYDDGTAGNTKQYARDVSAFLMWAAEPKLEQRKQLGFRVMIYLAILTVLLWLTKRSLWRRVEH